MQTPPPFGVGFRTQHFDELLAAPRSVDWLEILSDNHLGGGGARRAMLERLRGELPLALHGVGLNIASDTGPRPDYLARLRALADRVEPVFVSDHLCWTGFRGIESHDLLPVAYTEVLESVRERVARAQDALGRRLLLENASAYVAFRVDEMGEAEFFRELCARSGCGMLLDVNNLFVNAQNLGVDPSRYLDALDAEHIGYLHLAGHAVLRDVRIDTHASDVPDAVWNLYAEVVRRFPHAPVILERDDAIPPFAELARELSRARASWHCAARGEAGPAPRRARDVMEIADPGGALRVARADWRSLQDDFWRRLVDKPPGFDHRAVPGLEALLDPSRSVGAARGLCVYSDAYGETARRALAAHFPALARAIGEREFTALAAAYVSAHPSRSYDYVELGARFADFVRDHRFHDDLGVSQDALAELVALEQAQLEVQEAEDEDPAVGARDLQALSPSAWERVRFRFVAACRLVSATHDVLPSIRAVARGESPPRPLRAASAWLITRQRGVPFTDPIDPRAAEILGALAAGASFADACGGEPAGVERGVGALALAAERGALRERWIAPPFAARSDLGPSPGIEVACR